MTHHRLTHRILPVLAACACVAWLVQSPVAASATPDTSPHVTMATRSVAGTYTMLFRPTISGLGVTLDAYVTDASGAPAQAGAATFEVCSLQGTPAPHAICDGGSGSWKRYGTSGFIFSPSPLAGHALLAYTGAPAAGTIIGFRFRYSGRGSGIADGVSASVDHTF